LSRRSEGIIRTCDLRVMSTAAAPRPKGRWQGVCGCDRPSSSPLAQQPPSRVAGHIPTPYCPIPRGGVLIRDRRNQPTAQAGKRSKELPPRQLTRPAGAMAAQRLDHAMSPSWHAQMATDALRYARCATRSPWHRFVAPAPREVPAAISRTSSLDHARIPDNPCIHSEIGVA
jgi:hypothetical protein